MPTQYYILPRSGALHKRFVVHGVLNAALLYAMAYVLLEIVRPLGGHPAAIALFKPAVHPDFGLNVVILQIFAIVQILLTVAGEARYASTSAIFADNYQRDFCPSNKPAAYTRIYLGLGLTALGGHIICLMSPSPTTTLGRLTASPLGALSVLAMYGYLATAALLQPIWHMQHKKLLQGDGGAGIRDAK